MTSGWIDPRLIAIAGGVLTIASVIVFGAPKEAAAGPSKSISVRFAHFPNITHAPALIGVFDGTFAAELGPTASLDVKVVNAGPEAMEAMLANELDIVYVGPSPAINTYIKSGGKAATVVAGACSGGASLVATKESGILKLRDLAGKRVASPQLGNTQDVSLRHFITKEGLTSRTEGGQVEILPIKNPDILLQFKQRQLDAAWVPEPWATRIIEETGAIRVVDERDLWPNRTFPSTVIVVRRAFLEAHPALVEAIVRANSKVINRINGNQSQAKATVNLELKRLTGQALPQSIIDRSWPFLTFTDDPNPACFDTFVAAARACGFLKEAPSDLSDLFELSMLKRNRR